MSCKYLFLISYLAFVFCTGYIFVLQKAFFSFYKFQEVFVSVYEHMPECTCGGQRDFVASIFFLSSSSGFWGSAGLWHNRRYPQGHLAGPERVFFIVVFECGLSNLSSRYFLLALEPWLESLPSLWCFMVFVFLHLSVLIYMEFILLCSGSYSTNSQFASSCVLVF